jgi:hypothetical protein
VAGLAAGAPPPPQAARALPHRTADTIRTAREFRGKFMIVLFTVKAVTLIIR